MIRARLRIAALVFLALAIFIAVLYFALSGLLLNRYLQMETDLTNTNVDRLTHALQERLNGIALSARDYAYWDETFHFVLTGDAAVIENDFTDSILPLLNLNYFLVADQAGSVLYSNGMNLATREELEIPAEVRNLLAPGGVVLQRTLQGIEQQGALTYGPTVVMYAVMPILPGSGEGKPIGALLFARTLDGKEIDRLTTAIQIPVQMFTIGQGDLPQDVLLAVENSTTDSSFVQPLNDDQIAGYSFLRDDQGKIVAVARLIQARSFYQQGLNSQLYLFGSLAGAGLLFGLVILFVFDRLTVAQLERFKDHEMLKKMLGKLTDVVIMVDPQTARIQDATPSVLQVFGIAREDVLNKKVDVLGLNAEMVLANGKRGAALEGQTTPLQNQELNRVSGERFSAEAYFSPIYNQEGNIVQILAVIRDISSRKQAEQRLKERMEIEKMIASISAWFVHAGANNWEDEIGRVLQEMGSFTGVERCYLNVFSSDFKFVKKGYQWRSDKDGGRTLPVASFQFSEYTWMLRQLQEGHTISIDDLDTLPPEARAECESWQAQDYHTVLAIPLRQGTQLIGYLGFNSRRKGVIWSDADMRLIRSVGDVFTGALARFNAEDRLRISEERMQLALRGTEESIWDWNMRTGQIYYDDIWVRSLGYEPGEISFTLEWWLQNTDEAGQSAFKAAMDSYLQNRSDLFELQYRIRKKNREWMWVQASGHCVAYDVQGTPLRMIGTNRDITERRLAEEKLQRVEERYRHLVEHINAVVYISKRDELSTTLYISPQAESVLGFPPKQWLQDPDFWSKHVHPGDLENVLAEVQRCNVTGEPISVEYRMIANDGQLIWLHDNAVLRFENEDDLTGQWHGLLYNITHTKNSESQLGQALEMLEQRNRQLAQILDTSNSLKVNLGLTDLLQGIVRAASISLEYEIVVMNMRNPVTGQVEIPASIGLDEPGREVLENASISWEDIARLMDERYNFGGCYFIPKGAIDWNEGFANISYTVSDQSDSDSLNATDWHPGDVLLIPIHSFNREVVGVLSVDRPLSGKRPNPGTIQTLEIFANQAAIAIENSALYEKAQDELSERRQVEEDLRYLSSHDILTGIFNRTYFESAMSSIGESGSSPVSIIMVDVDGMKAVNDRLGHAEGDDLLRRAAQVLRASVRADDVVARIGGDEFAIILPLAEETVADHVVQRIRELLAGHNSDHELPLSLSIGVSTGNNGEALNLILHDADARMYKEKLGKEWRLRS